MDRIFYGICGEGLGHASRTLAVVDRLPNCEVHIFTYGKAYEFLKKMNYPHLHQIHGMMFSYRNGRVSYGRLAKTAFRYFGKEMRQNIRLITKQFESLRPKLFVADFEPSLPRAAKRCSAKLISVDNQHRFAYTDLAELPLFLRAYGWGCGLAAKFLVPSPNFTVISTFHFDHIKPKGKRVILTNGLLRKELEQLEPTNEGFVLLYLRESVSEAILSAIRKIEDREVRVYGASDKPRKQWLERFRPNVRFLPLSPGFMKDLAACHCLISTAGNQLITEARYLKKPCLVIPEPGQYEQAINAFYVEKIGIGRQCPVDRLTFKFVEDFVKNFRNETGGVPNGVDTVAEVIRDYIQT